MNCFILRGVSGAGKSTLARTLTTPDNICEADEFRYVDGVYNYHPEDNEIVHKKCMMKFCELLRKNTETVVVSNTNIKEWEFTNYKRLAEEHGYTVFVLTVNKLHDNNNVHNVPESIVQCMKDKFEHF